MATLAPQMTPPADAARLTLASELRALKAIIRRSWLTFVRYPSWVIAMFIWPVIFPASYILLGNALAGPGRDSLALFNSRAGTSNFLGYIAIGTTIWMWQNVVLWGVGFSLREEQMRGTLETNWMAPTWRFSYLLGSSVTHLVSMLAFLVISGVEFSLLYGVRYHGNPLLVFLMVLAAIPSIYGMGFTFASLVITAKEASAFVYLVRGLVMIFCGITFPISLLPVWMQSVARWLPQTYIINGMRNALLNGAGYETLRPDLLALAGFGLFWLVVGYLLFQWMDRRARQTGAIGQY